MARYSAIASVSRTLERLLNARFKVDQPVPNAKAVLVRTEDFETGAGLIAPPALSIFLVRADVNYTMRAPMGAAAAADRRGHLPLDLHYLLTAWARNAEHEHRLIGSAMTCLEDMATLTGPMLDASNDARWSPMETLQILPEEMTTEAVMRTFDSLSARYRLSVPYLVRVVQLTGPDPNEVAPTTTVVTGTLPSVTP